MKTQPNILLLIFFVLINLFISELLFGVKEEKTSNMIESDEVATLKNVLRSLSDNAEVELFSIHFQSIIDVINSKGVLSKSDTSFLKATLPVFTNHEIQGNASETSSYLNRQRQLVISWISPTDGKTSFLRLRLPKNWDPNKSYPLYVELHGLWNVADNPIEFMTYAYRNNPSTSFQFEDGYQILPWGRGNLWYQGISETDIWEGIKKIESLVKIDQSRKYLTGHSMGGYGAWSIASKSADVWAAIGIHAGALWYGNDNMLSSDKIENLSGVPTYFVVGNSDGLYDINLQASRLLISAGNLDVVFVSFPGGHDYLTENVEYMYLWLRMFVNDGCTKIETMDNAVRSRFRIYPNPVRTETTIHCNLEKPGLVQMEIFDLSGKKVTTVINRELNSGETIIPWSRGDLRSGIYAYTIKIGQQKEYGKLVLF